MKCKVYELILMSCQHEQYYSHKSFFMLITLCAAWHFTFPNSTCAFHETQNKNISWMSSEAFTFSHKYRGYQCSIYVPVHVSLSLQRVTKMVTSGFAEKTVTSEMNTMQCNCSPEGKQMQKWAGTRLKEIISQRLHKHWNNIEYLYRHLIQNHI